MEEHWDCPTFVEQTADGFMFPRLRDGSVAEGAIRQFSDWVSDKLGRPMVVSAMDAGTLATWIPRQGWRVEGPDGLLRAPEEGGIESILRAQLARLGIAVTPEVEDF